MKLLLLDGDVEDIVFLTNMLPCHFEDTRVGISMEYDIGEDYDWSKQNCPVSFILMMCVHYILCLTFFSIPI